MVRSLLFKTRVPITEKVELRIPTIGEILDFGEEKYFAGISAFIAQPFTYMAMLDDAGLDYEEVTEFQMFCYLVPSLDPKLVQFLFGDTLTFESYWRTADQGGQVLAVAIDNETDEMLLMNPNDYSDTFTPVELRFIADVIRQAHFFKEEKRKAGNAAAKEFLIERSKRKAARAKNKPYEPFLEPLIVALVNAPEFPYTYESVQTLTIYQFMCSVTQIPRRIHYDNLMHGTYVGMIDTSKIDMKEADWLLPKLTAS